MVKKIKKTKMMDNQQSKVGIRKDMKASNNKRIMYKIKLLDNRIHLSHKAHHHKPHLNKIPPRNKNKINNKNMKI